MDSITVYNAKGGTGKTSLSLALALKTGNTIITNDIYSPIDDVLPSSKVLKLEPNEKVPILDYSSPIIYDLGGHMMDTRISQCLKQSKTILIPTLTDYTSLKTTMYAIKEVEEFNKNIILIINKVSNEKEFFEAHKILSNFFTYEILRVKESKCFQNMFKNKKSIDEMMQENKLITRAYTEVNNQLINIINTLDSKDNIKSA
ncbi:MAG: hypothetical protein JKY89_01265 [Immundisolibacteraceae bacterium]|nr:hypothetical protein [Immundisolibacteraceae bacterium]